jgi:O-antigen/teichoic acid export membrane protein
VKELMQFGRWVFFSTLLTFVALQLDKFIFVPLVPMAVLGVYNIALSICRLPTEVVQRIGSTVAFPAFSRLKDKEANLGSAYLD